MRILLAEDDDSMRQLYTMFLDNFTEEVDVVECMSGNQAVKVLREDVKFDIIISDYNMPEGSGGDLYNHVKKTKLNIPFMLLSAEEVSKLPEFVSMDQDNHLNSYVKKPIKLNTFKEAVQSTMSAKSASEVVFPDQTYKRIRVAYFLRFNKVLCDVYIKLSDVKYVKLINRDDVYSKERIRKYTKKKLKYLHIRQEDYENFAVNFASTPFLVLDGNLPMDDVERAVVSSLEIAQDLVNTVGIGETVTKLVEASMDQIERTFQDDLQLEKLISKQRSREDFVSEHSYLVAYVCSVICSEMEWESADTRKKLSYAAFFHDITIDDPDVDINLDLESKWSDDYVKEEIAQFKNHPIVVSNLVKESKHTPPNVDEIILQHHENPEQTGYPRKLGALRVPVLVGVFNVAHAFIIELYKYDFDESMHEDILYNMGQRWGVGNYKAPMKALIKNFAEISKQLLLKEK